MRVRSRWVTRLAARLGTAILRVLYATCRVRTYADVAGINPYEGTDSRRYLYSAWHDQILMVAFSGRGQYVAGLVSRHQDGSYLAHAMDFLGITPVRGSTNHGGGRAMRELIEKTKNLHVCITPDGPRGPRHKMKLGIVFLASHTGRGIVPTAYACRRSWRIRGNWTDMLFPMPFTTIYVRGGKPLLVPAGLSRAELEQHAAQLEAEMNRLEAEVEALARGEKMPGADFQRLDAAA